MAGLLESACKLALRGNGGFQYSRLCSILQGTASTSPKGVLHLLLLSLCRASDIVQDHPATQQQRSLQVGDSS